VKVVITGGTGFIGAPLVRRFLEHGDEVLVVSRDPANVRQGRGIGWDAAGEIAAAGAVINLAGENVGQRWTEERKRRILESRVRATTALVAAMQSEPRRERVFVSASAIHWYGLHGGEVLDESSPPGEGFLAEVTHRWEELARGAGEVARVVIFRQGVVLGAGGGALEKIALPFRLGVGGPIGSGRQWMSWIDREDVLRAMEWAVGRPEVRGAYNLTAPHAVTNREFAKTLARVLHRPALIPTPGFPLRAVFGQMADEMLLGGQRVMPARLVAEGFEFEYPALESALRHALRAA